MLYWGEIMVNTVPGPPSRADAAGASLSAFARNSAGLGTLLLWQWLTVLKGPLFAVASATLFRERRMGYVVFSLVLCATLFVISRFGARLARSWNRNVLWCAAVLMALAWLPAAIALNGLSHAGAVLVLSLPAVGSAIQITSWEWMLSRSPGPHRSTIFGAACAVRTFAIPALTLLLPALLPFAAPLLPFVVARLWSVPAEDDAGPAEDDAPEAQGGPVRNDIRLPRAFVFRAASFFVVSAMFVSLFLARMGGRMGLADVFSDPFSTIGAIAVALYLRRAPEPAPARIYLCAETLLAIGFLSLAAVGSGSPFFPMACLQSGAGIFGSFIFAEILRFGAQTGRDGALPLVATGQMTVTGALLSGTLLASAIGLLPAADGLSIVLTSGLLGIGILFFSGLFFRNGRSGDAPKNVPDGTEDASRETAPDEAPTTEELLGLRLLQLGLSRREVCVALLVAQGQSNDEIAGILCITANTVRSHMKSIHKKTGSSCRAELREQLEQMRRR
jgi:DNA-binding CsgD family transcriptional regulator